VGPVNSSLSQPPLAVWNSTKPGSFFIFHTFLFRLTCMYFSAFVERRCICIVVLHCTQKSKGVIKKCQNQDFELT
jgi:hypothetical protein